MSFSLTVLAAPDVETSRRQHQSRRSIPNSVDRSIFVQYTLEMMIELSRIAKRLRTSWQFRVDGISGALGSHDVQGVLVVWESSQTFGFQLALADLSTMTRLSGYILSMGFQTNMRQIAAAFSST
ncbi:hypothetical protein P152DRAFT_446984 [Eremomyces bilateralis CBS 781.70]|uniref:Uncharacterized protein n=1 Tax=Eremomyces bilateralis CBS 781.70 TaxID=1392243 RepID=A0A6G1GDA3_9PEZI|nr:uncharacterized protein P152DRAFT_446984 [Eremomyces bilateralis CBS 781.70]KAF1815992.1 hypothetical protein P152DRAFT_446984 [Eremomyces bilateralis CBS 781.70]